MRESVEMYRIVGKLMLYEAHTDIIMRPVSGMGAEWRGETGTTDWGGEWCGVGSGVGLPGGVGIGGRGEGRTVIARRMPNDWLTEQEALSCVLTTAVAITRHQ